MIEQSSRKLEERRVTMTSEERTAAEERQRARDALWAECSAGLPDTLDGKWEARARAFARLGPHDFFAGPGPLLVETISTATKARTFSHRHHEPTWTPVLSALRAALEACGLTGRVRLTMHEAQVDDRPPYIHAHLSFTEWALIPAICRREADRLLRFQDSWGLDEPAFLGNVLDVVWNEDRVDTALRCLLMDDTHPLHPHLLAAMCAEPGGSIPVWEAWACIDLSRDPHWGEPRPCYEDIEQWPAIMVSAASAVEALDHGVVVVWPPTGERVRIRMDRHEDIEPGQWRFEPRGARVLHIEPTDAPLTPGVDGRGTIQVFGQGHSQQSDRVPTVPGHRTVCLLSWDDPSDFTVTITVSVDELGRPAYAWADTSAT